MSDPISVSPPSSSLGVSPRTETPESRYICEFCFNVWFAPTFPTGWQFVWQSYICPTCWPRVQEDGGVGVVIGGAYAEGKADPRARPVSPEPTAATPAYYCMACSLTFATAGASNAHYDATGHYSTWKSESAFGAEPSRETQAPPDYEVLDLWLERRMDSIRDGDEFAKDARHEITRRMRTYLMAARELNERESAGEPSGTTPAPCPCAKCVLYRECRLSGGTTPRTPEPAEAIKYAEWKAYRKGWMDAQFGPHDDKAGFEELSAKADHFARKYANREDPS